MLIITFKNAQSPRQSLYYAICMSEHPVIKKPSCEGMVGDATGILRGSAAGKIIMPALDRVAPILIWLISICIIGRGLLSRGSCPDKSNHDTLIPVHHTVATRKGYFFNLSIFSAPLVYAATPSMANIPSHISEGIAITSTPAPRAFA